MIDQEMQTIAEKFWQEIEIEAEENHVTVEYFMEEFYCT